MIGQTFAPTGGDPTQRPSGPSGAQDAIKILNLRYPRVQGAAAPAPQALLEGAGSAGLPQQNAVNPTIEAILRAVLGGQFSAPQPHAPSAPGGMMPNAVAPPPSVQTGGQTGGQAPGGKLTPAVHYQPNPPQGQALGQPQSGNDNALLNFMRSKYQGNL